jgi:hypothetical protein
MSAQMPVTIMLTKAGPRSSNTPWALLVSSSSQRLIGLADGLTKAQPAARNATFATPSIS